MTVTPMSGLQEPGSVGADVCGWGKGQHDVGVLGKALSGASASTLREEEENSDEETWDANTRHSASVMQQIQAAAGN